MARLRLHDDGRIRQARLTMLAVLFQAGAVLSATATGVTTATALITTPSTSAATNTTASSTTPTPTVYIPSAAPSTGAAAATGIVRTYIYQGCFLEISGLNGTAPGVRSLQGGTMDEVLPGDMTASKCLAYCGGGGSGTAYTYAGLEYARECWCGQDLAALATRQPDAECDLPCDGASDTLCGGSQRLTLYMLKSASGRPAAAIGAVLAVAGLAAAVQLL